MLVYVFEFPDPVAGLAVTVVDITGATVASGTLGSVNGTGQIPFLATLDLGDYSAHVDTSGLTPRPAPDIAHIVTAPGEIDFARSIAGAGGAFETARFTATGSGVTDGTNFDLTPVVKAGTTLPDWVTLVDGVITITEPGLYVPGALATPAIHFPTTVPGDPNGLLDLTCDTSLLFPTLTYTSYGSTGADVSPTIRPVMSSPNTVNAGSTLGFTAHVTAIAADGSTPITDGTVAFTLHAEITRLVPAPSA